METAEFNENWKDRIEQFLTYKHQHSSSKFNNAKELLKQLPECVVREILYHSCKEMLENLFKGIESENFLRDLAYYVET